MFNLFFFNFVFTDVLVEFKTSAEIQKSTPNIISFTQIVINQNMNPVPNVYVVTLIAILGAAIIIFPIVIMLYRMMKFRMQFNTDNAMEMTKTSLPTKKISPIAWKFFMTILKDQRTHLTLVTNMRKLPLGNPSNQILKSIQVPMNRGKQTRTTYHLYSIHEN